MSAQDIALRISENEKAMLMTNICKDLTEPEFNLFLKNSLHRGLDPFVGQIVPMVFNKRDPSKRRVTYVTTIDGYRSLASQSGKYEGVTDKKLLVSMRSNKDREDELIPHELFNPQKHELVSATVYGKRSDMPQQSKSTVLMSYYTHLMSENENWKRSPDRMLLKCAEAQLIRILFPHEMASFYTDEEVQAENLQDHTVIQDEHSNPTKPVRTSARPARTNTTPHITPAAQNPEALPPSIAQATEANHQSAPDVMRQLWSKIEDHLRSYPSCTDETLETAKNLATAHFNVTELESLTIDQMDALRKYAKTTMLKELYNLQLLNFERP
jgi:phage recombination protein Bet